MATEDKKDEELKVTAQDDGSAIVGDVDAKPDVKEEVSEDEDEPITQHADNGDEAGHAEETPEEAAERTARNRKRRTENKERRKDYIESLKREQDALRRQNEELSQRLAGVEKQSQGPRLPSLTVPSRKRRTSITTSGASTSRLSSKPMVPLPSRHKRRCSPRVSGITNSLALSRT